jgi:hypothetical protein
MSKSEQSSMLLIKAGFDKYVVLRSLGTTTHNVVG